MRRAPLVKSRPPTSPPAPPHPPRLLAPIPATCPPMGPDTSARAGPSASDFQNLPAASWPRMPVSIQRPAARHVSGPSHVGVRCGAPAPEETDTAQTSLLSASRLASEEKHSARRNQLQRLACLLARSLAVPALHSHPRLGQPGNRR
ncbi:unnamed protein product [Urochloa humidicola]